MDYSLKSLDIGGLKIKYPIIQGGMGVRVSTASLASAVSNEGALGVIAAVGLAEDYSLSAQDYRGSARKALAESIQKTRKLTKNPFGVNIMCALSNYEELVDTAQQEGIDVIISGAGLPLKLPSLVKNNKTKIVPIVSSGRAAHIICQAWQRKYNRLPDAIVVEGPLAGGHLGFSLQELSNKEDFKLEKLLVDVLPVAKEYGKNDKAIPVIVAGGVYDGKDMAKFLRLGAAGVQIATRFVCTHECDVSQAYKDAYINAKEEDIVIIQSPVGMPGRVVRNEFVRKITSGERIDFNCAYLCLSTCKPNKVNYCIAKALVNAADGRMDKGFAMCGSNAYRIDKIISVKELINELLTEAEAALKS